MYSALKARITFKIVSMKDHWVMVTVNRFLLSTVVSYGTTEFCKDKHDILNVIVIGERPKPLPTGTRVGIAVGVIIAILAITFGVGCTKGKEFWRVRHQHKWYNTLTTPKNWCQCCTACWRVRHQHEWYNTLTTPKKWCQCCPHCDCTCPRHSVTPATANVRTVSITTDPPASSVSWRPNYWDQVMIFNDYRLEGPQLLQKSRKHHHYHLDKKQSQRILNWWLILPLLTMQQLTCLLQRKGVRSLTLIPRGILQFIQEKTVSYIHSTYHINQLQVIANRPSLSSN